MKRRSKDTILRYALEAAVFALAVFAGVIALVELLSVLFGCSGSIGDGVDLDAYLRPGEVTLAWDAPPTEFDAETNNDLDGYRVYGQRPGAAAELVADVDGLEVTIEDLPPDTWSFWVTAYNEGGESSASNVVTVPVFAFE